MPTIGRPPPSTVARVSSPSAQPAQPKTASTASAATTGDNFTAGAPASGGVRGALDGARKMLGELGEQSEAVKDLTRLLEKGVPNKSDFDKVVDHYGELAPKLTEPQRKILEKALSYQLMGRSALDAFKAQMEKMFADLNKKPE